MPHRLERGKARMLKIIALPNFGNRSFGILIDGEPVKMLGLKSMREAERLLFGLTG